MPERIGGGDIAHVTERQLLQLDRVAQKGGNHVELTRLERQFGWSTGMASELLKSRLAEKQTTGFAHQERHGLDRFPATVASSEQVPVRADPFQVKRVPPVPSAEIFLSDRDPTHREDLGTELNVIVSGLEGGGHLWFLNRSAHPETPLVPREGDEHWIKARVGDVGATGKRPIDLSASQRRALRPESGDVIQIIQADEKGDLSKHSFTRVDDALRNDAAGPVLATKMTYRPLREQQPDAVDPHAFRQIYDVRSSEFTLQNKIGQVALMPQSVFRVDRGFTTALGHPLLREGGSEESVRHDGGFSTRVREVKPHDAVVLALEGSPGRRGVEKDWAKRMGIDDQAAQRRVVFSVDTSEPTVVDHPDLGTTRRIQVSPGRIKASLQGVFGEPGSATKGSLVEAVDLTHGRKYVTAVREDGSFERPMEGGAIENSVNVRIIHPFGERYGVEELGTHKLRAAPSPLSKEATGAVGSNHAGPLRVRFQDIQLGFSTYNRSTGNSATVNAEADWTGGLREAFRFDPAKREVVMTVSVDRNAAVPNWPGQAPGHAGKVWGEPHFRVDELQPRRPQRAGFGALGEDQNSGVNRQVQLFREWLPKLGVGAELPIRIETPEGREVGHGRLVVSEESQPHSTGPGVENHPVWAAKLVSGSLHYAADEKHPG
jgi:hypothetical protein